MSHSFTCMYCQKTYTYKNANSLYSGKSSHNISYKHLRNVEEYKKNNSQTKHITTLTDDLEKAHRRIDTIFKSFLAIINVLETRIMKLEQKQS